MSSDLHAVPGGLDVPDDPIAEIQARLRKYPQARAELASDRVIVHPTSPKGFEVGFRIRAHRYQVHCEGWHEEFDNSGEALDCFAFALSPACRLKVTSRGRMAHRWELQYLRDGRWVAHSVVGLWFFPFWRSAEVTYLQNNLLEAA